MCSAVWPIHSANGCTVKGGCVASARRVSPLSGGRRGEGDEMKRTFAAVAAAGLAALGLASVVPIGPASATSSGACVESGTTTVTVTCSIANDASGVGSWTPPARLLSAVVVVEGGHGGAGSGGGTAPGGAGGIAIATVGVSSAITYSVIVGGHGGNGTGASAGTAGANGGGAGSLGSAGSGGGGGRSEIDLSTTRLVVAGGGGV